MSLRDAILRLLSRGAVTADDDSPVEIALVPLARGPMLVTFLVDRGFDATGAETFNVLTEVRSDYRILVPRGQAAGATAALDEIL